MSAQAEAQPLARAGRPPGALARGLKVIDRLSNALCALATVLLAVLLVGSLAGFRPLVEHSGSMSPAIEPGDLLVTRLAPATSIHPGAIVSFNDPALRGRLITHRVIEVEVSRGRVRFITRGDANAVPERWSVAPSATVSVLRARIPWVGGATAWMAEGLDRTLALSLLAFVLSVCLLRRIWRA